MRISVMHQETIRYLIDPLLSVGGSFKDVYPLLYIGKERPDEKDGGYSCYVSWRNGENFKHHPSKDDEKAEGARFSRPVGSDGHRTLNFLENSYTKKDYKIS